MTTRFITALAASALLTACVIAGAHPKVLAAYLDEEDEPETKEAS